MLETIDLKKTITKPKYSEIMPKLQERLRLLQYAAKDAEIPVIICLEGWDTSGKGVVVKKLTERLDPRLFRVKPGTPPSPLEQRYHFLWRYQMNLPNDGEMMVFDHSWYGRVLVERCDKLVKKKAWREAYEQINEFEKWLADDGQVIIKLWLHISKKEQARRFRKYKADKLLRWKITKEYERHHKQYARWYEAAEEMLTRTGTPHAPWTIVEATDLRWIRVRVFQVLVERLESELARRKISPQMISRTAAAKEFRRSETGKAKPVPIQEKPAKVEAAHA
jgi:AMP-polyphosphate phosphotransferase